MDDASSLEEEFELDLLLEPEEHPPASTPRQRLEDARAMADGNCDVSLGGGGDFPALESVDGDGEGPDTSMHLLQRLSCAVADSGEWKCFHDIAHESQRALAEMNETLGSLRQWQKQRNADSLSSAPTGLEDPPTPAVGEQRLSGANPCTPIGCSSEAVETTTRDGRGSGGDGTDAGGLENVYAVLDKDVSGGEQEDPLLVLWQEHHLRAQQAVGRLQEQLDRHPPALSAETRDGTSENAAERKKADQTTHDRELTMRNILTGGDGAAQQPSSGNVGDVDRVAKLSRSVDGLQIHEWIQTTRTQACDRAETLAREACEDVRRGAGSAAVGEMEGELDGFARELDSLLLRIDRVDNDNRGEEGRHGNDVFLQVDGLAPVADAHVDRAAVG